MASNIQSTSVTFISKNGSNPHFDHCPLCIDSMVHPKEDDRKPAIVFLDMDGVMIGDRFTVPLSDQIRSTLGELFQCDEYSDYQWTIAKGRHLDSQALKNLHLLINRIENSGQRALVVLSSAWRNDATLQQHREEVFAQHLFCKYLCGKAAPEELETKWTPEYKQGFEFANGAEKSFGLKLKNRSDVIEFWLRDHGFVPRSTNFVVIDDHRGEKRERFRERFIEINRLFKEEDLKVALKALNILCQS